MEQRTMNNWRRILLPVGGLICLTLVFASSHKAFSQPPAKPPELKGLDRYIGKWKFEIIHKPAAWTPKEVRVTGTSTNEWVLDGWFQHHKVKDDQGNEGIDIMTYDPRKRAYRSWHYSSLGYATEMTGTWDEKTKTFTVKGDFGDGITAIATMRFLDNDNRESTLIAKDATGKIYLDSRGKLTREK
jgi:hypothetical protein